MKEFTDFVQELEDESDRASVVIAASQMDEMLRIVLSTYLVPCGRSTDDLLEGDGPVSSFSSRIRLCFRLGLIDANFARVLDLFRKIRNDFAHSTSKSALATHKDRIKELEKAFNFSTTFITDQVDVFKNSKHDHLSKQVRLLSTMIFIRLQLLVRDTEICKNSPGPLVPEFWRTSVAKKNLPVEKGGASDIVSGKKDK